MMLLKKLATSALITTLILCAAALPMSAKDLRINAAYGTPVVDGVMDDLYRGGTSYEVKYSEGASYSKATVYSVWDETTLYLFAEVLDDTPSTQADITTITNIWKTDCIEFGINLDLTEVGDPHKIAKGGVWLAAPMYGSQMDIYGKLNAVPSVKEGTQCSVKTTATGWSVELALPIMSESTAGKAKAGMEIGFYALTHNDTNDDNSRDSITSANAENLLANYDSANMDYIVLLDKPAVAAEVTTSPKTADSTLLAVIAAGIGAGMLLGAVKIKHR